MKKSAVRKQPLVCDYMTPMPHTIGIEQTAAKANEMMVHLKARHLPVLDDGHLVGVISERDLRLVRSQDQADVKVDELMSDEVYAVEANRKLAEVAKYMAHHRLGSAVVTAEDRVIGILTSTDVSRALADVLATKG